MKTGLMIAAALFAGTASAPAQASDYIEDTGNWFLSTCNDSTYFSKGVCLGYTQATWNAANLILGSVNKKTCIPVGATLGQVQDVLKQYLWNHAEKRNQNMMVVFAEATNAAWNCE